MDIVLLSGTLPMLSPFPRKLVVFPWEVKGLLYSSLAHSTSRVYFSVSKTTLMCMRVCVCVNSEVNYQGKDWYPPPTPMLVKIIEWAMSYEEQGKELVMFSQKLTPFSEKA